VAIVRSSTEEQAVLAFVGQLTRRDRALGVHGVAASACHRRRARRGDVVCLVDHQDVWIDVDRDREGQTDVHTTGVELHLGIDEVLDLTEIDDVVEDGLHHFFGETEHRAVEEDVVATGELGLEPGAQFEQRRETSAKMNLTRGRLQDAANTFQ